MLNKKEIRMEWIGNIERPLISICSLTFNYEEKWIKEKII